MLDMDTPSPLMRTVKLGEDGKERALLARSYVGNKALPFGRPASPRLRGQASWPRLADPGSYPGHGTLLALVEPDPNLAHAQRSSGRALVFLTWRCTWPTPSVRSAVCSWGRT